MNEKLRPVVPVVLCIAVVVALIVAWLDTSNKLIPLVDSPEMVITDLGAKIRTGNAPLPIFTEDVRLKLASSTGFSVVVSYTDEGFQPQEISVPVGTRIRFTNNASHDEWVAADARFGAKYPRAEVGCSDSSLDSCSHLQPQDFWEFTVKEKGNWGYSNILSKVHAGIIHVR